MEKSKSHDELGKLIRKRKEETDAFKKLLSAIEQKEAKPEVPLEPMPKQTKPSK